MAETQRRAAIIRILPKRELLAETERLANMRNKLQTDVLDRVGLQQSSSKDFPFATGPLFGTEK
jgi:hypothetical protein